MLTDFLTKRIQEQRDRDSAGPVISLRLSSKDDLLAAKIAEQHGLTKQQLAKAALLATLDGYREEQGVDSE